MKKHNLIIKIKWILSRLWNIPLQSTDINNTGMEVAKEPAIRPMDESKPNNIMANLWEIVSLSTLLETPVKYG